MFACFFRAIARTVQLRIVATVIAVLAPIPLGGCVGFLSAELNNRGGYIDQKLDNYWMVADTKQMRILRAYILIGSIARLAQTKYQSERELIIQHVNTSIKVASDAYYCAFSQPGRCVYFDERMVELEVSVLRLLAAVISSKEDEELFGAVSKQLSETFPLLKAIDSVSKLAETVTATGEAALNASKIIQAVLKFGQSAYVKGRRLGALYRDSIELYMIASLSSLDTMCAIKNRHFVKYNTVSKTYLDATTLDGNRQWAVDNFYGRPEELPGDACTTFKKGFALWQRGAGDLSLWRAYLDTDVALYRGWLIPNEEVFIQASDLIWRSCEHLTSDLDELSDCLGRRKVKNGRTPFECAIKFDTDPEAFDKADRIKADSKRSVGEDAVQTNQCRLILYSKTIELRTESRRHNGANARLYWLSNLTPSPSHPLIYHPTQHY
ncbi:MAG: hypothetical protein ABL908_03395 [Hyphomicrobium sp.]